MKVDLSVSIGEINFKNPVLVASGTFGYGEEYSKLINLNRLGGIVTKSITLKPKKGHPPARTCETPAGMLNCIGLENVGVDRFIREKLPFLKKFKTKIIINVAGSTVEEYVEVVEKLNESQGIDMLEINISCPNVKEGGMIFGCDTKLAYDCVKKVKEKSKFPIMVKLSPNVRDITEIASAVQEAGADAISLINTLVGMAIDLEKRKPILSNVTGGLSGPAIKPVALAMVYKVAQKVKIPIIGIGGILDYKDALEFILAGASLIQIGTANFVDPQSSIKIIEGMEKYCQENNISSSKSLVGKLDTSKKE
ncbi:MAG: dihydroorotate dehydrogenase [candidate division Zixibacteria bacterium]|nr:dihydroorotate dehydrogenase [candidate division Zixibacteria bacterium]